jgi:hypothetical protein
MISEAQLTQLERQHEAGLSSLEILEVFAQHGVALSEATLRKYVQLGLLPRSVRVGQKGKHQGSRGIYPVSVVRQILRVKQMMAESYTIEQIQQEFLFMRSDLQALELTLSNLFKKLEAVMSKRREEAVVRVVARELSDARSLSKELVTRFSSIEKRLTSRAEVQTLAVS